jgi:hypothetical protein
MIWLSADFPSKTAKIIATNLNQFLTVCKGHHFMGNDNKKKANIIG